MGGRSDGGTRAHPLILVNANTGPAVRGLVQVNSQLEHDGEDVAEGG